MSRLYAGILLSASILTSTIFLYKLVKSICCKERKKDINTDKHSPKLKSNDIALHISKNAYTELIETFPPIEKTPNFLKAIDAYLLGHKFLACSFLMNDDFIYSKLFIEYILGRTSRFHIFNDECVTVCFYKAKIFRNTDNFTEFEKYIKMALKKPDNMFVYKFLIKLKSKEDLEQAKKLSEKALKLYKDDVSLLYLLYNLDIYKEKCNLSLKDTMAYYLMGKYSESDNDVAQAIMFYKKSVEEDIYHFRALINICMLLIKTKNAEEAMNYMKLALKCAKPKNRKEIALLMIKYIEKEAKSTELRQ